MTALYFGARLTDATLTPGPGIRVGATLLENGLATNAAATCGDDGPITKAQSRFAMQSPLSPTSSASNSDALASSFPTSYARIIAFMASVAEGSFAKAGDRLGIGRSAVSRGVQKLEAQVGARLLSRTTRRLSLTREGEIFHARCHPCVTRISQALEDLRDLRDGPPRRRLRICASVGFGRKVVAPLLWSFQAKYPDIDN